MRLLPVTVLSLVLACPLFGQGYSFQTIAVPQSNTETHVQAINNNGAVVGYYFLGTGGTRGFKRDPAGNYEYPISDPLGHLTTFPAGINQNGMIVGYFQGPPHATVHGFVAEGVNGPFYTVDLRPRPWTAIFGVNNLGNFCGGTGQAQGGVDLFTQAFISINGTVTKFVVPGVTYTTAHGIAWDGSVVGDTYDGVEVLSFLRGPKGNILQFASDQSPTNGRTFAYGINNEAGMIVGFYADAAGNFHGFIYRYVDDLAALGTNSGTAVKAVPVEVLDYPGAIETRLTGVNAKGVIVGTAFLQDFSTIAFIATPN